MTTKTNQENQKPNGQHDLSQIIADQEPCNQMHCEMHQTGNYARQITNNQTCPKCGANYNDCPNIFRNGEKNLCGECFSQMSDSEQDAFYLVPEPKEGTREAVENLLEGLEGANITATIKRLNGIERGSYFVTIKNDNEWNEIIVKLRERHGSNQIASGHIDKGHTTESRFEAAAEVRGLVRAYLCR